MNSLKGNFFITFYTAGSGTKPCVVFIKVPVAVDVAQVLVDPALELEREAVGHGIVRVVVEEDVLGAWRPRRESGKCSSQ